MSLPPNTVEEDDDTNQEELNIHNDMDERQMLSFIIPSNTIFMSHIETLGHRDFDLNHVWNDTTSSNVSLENPTNFIKIQV